MSDGASHAAIEAWTRGARAGLARLEPPALDAIVSRASEHLREPGLPASTRGGLLLLRAQARGRLAGQGVARRENGAAFLLDSMAAVDEAPGDRLVVLSWARVVRGMATRGWITRKLIEAVTKVRIDREARRLVALLPCFSGDPLALLLSEQLGAAIGDEAAVQTARSGLAALPAVALAEARATLAGDGALAEAAQAEHA